VSATEAEEGCLEQIKSVEDLYWIEQEEWEREALSHQI